MSPAAGRRLISVVRREVHATVMLVRGQAELASWPLTGIGSPDVSVVDALARMQLAARRAGCAIRLRDACPELTELLDLCGLTCGRGGLCVELGGLAVAAGGLAVQAGGLAVEVGRQAENGEQVGVEEVVVADDPVA